MAREMEMELFILTIVIDTKETKKMIDSGVQEIYFFTIDLYTAENGEMVRWMKKKL